MLFAGAGAGAGAAIEEAPAPTPPRPERCKRASGRPPTPRRVRNAIRALLEETSTWAVVGLSPDPNRDSHRIAALLQRRDKRGRGRATLVSSSMTSTRYQLR